MPEILETYPFEDEFEQAALAFLVRDIKFYLRNKYIVKRTYFENDLRRNTFELASKYMDKYNEAPNKEILRNEITKMFHEQKKKDTDIEDYWELLDLLFQKDLTKGEQYSEDLMKDFARNREMKIAVIDAQERLLGGKDLRPILTTVTKALEVGEKQSNLWEKLTTSALVREESLQAAEMVVEGFIPKGSVAFFYGKTNTCKTYLMLQLAEAIATGKPWFGRKTLPMPAYYVAYETTRGEFKERFNVIDSKKIIFWHRTERPAPPKLDSKEFVPTFAAFPPGFIVFDALKSGMRLDIKENKDMSRIMENLRCLVDVGHTVALLHNTTKADETKFSGAQTLADEADVCFLIRRVRAMESNDEVEEGVIPFKELVKLPLRFEIVDKAKFQFKEEDLEPMFFKFGKAEGGLYQIDSPDLADMKRLIEEMEGWTEKINEGKTVDTLVANLHLKKKRVQWLLKLGVDKKRLDKVPLPGTKSNEKTYVVL